MFSDQNAPDIQPPIYILDSDASSEPDPAFKVDNVFPEKVWQDMINVEEEKNLIKNLTVEYDRYIKNSTVD